MHLDPAVVAAGTRLIVRDKVTSTNAELLALARTGECGPLWMVADTQSAGRGRRGRIWVSAPGNLHASLLLTGFATGVLTAQLSFAAALAIHDAIAEHAPNIAMRLSLKWPNDVLCDGKKLCGILLEGESAGAGATTVVVGIGVNCAHHPEDAEYPATSLATSGATVSPDLLFLSLSRTMATRIAQWSGGHGFSATRRDWLARAEGLGRAMRVRLQDREVEGVFEALDERGYLLMRLADGSIETVAAGDVFPIHSYPVEQA